MLSVVTPADTSPSTEPSGPSTGTTACTSRPIVPSISSVTGRPASAGATVPTNFFPMRSGLGWVKRIASVFMTTTKSTCAFLRTSSALGCSTLVGSGPCSAWRVPGALANVSATARDRLRASSVLS